jgi:uncharacterized protein YaeQ
MNYFYKTIFLISLQLLAWVAWGQDNVQITLGPDEIGENQAWTITVTVNNDRLKNYDNFPGYRRFS